MRIPPNTGRVSSLWSCRPWHSAGSYVQVRLLLVAKHLYIFLMRGFLKGLIYGLFPQLSFISALVISACLTPTDPILASAIVGGKFAENNVPENIRFLLQAESAANDGLAYPFLSISLYLTLERSSLVAVGKWVLVGCLCKFRYKVLLTTMSNLSNFRPSRSWDCTRICHG